MQQKYIAAAIVAIGTGLSQSGFAEGFGFSETLALSQSLPQIGHLIEIAGGNLDMASNTIRFTDQSLHTISTPDRTTSLRSLLTGSAATLLIDGKQLLMNTSATSFSDAYRNPNLANAFKIQTVVDGRPWMMEWRGRLNDMNSSNTFVVTVNGKAVTIILPAGMTLRDFSGTTPVTILDTNNAVQLHEQRFNTLPNDQAVAIAANLGVLGVDMTLRGAQQQAMAHNFNLISDQIRADMQPMPSSRTPADRGGMVGWVGAQSHNISGDVRGTLYDGDTRMAMGGLGKRMGNLLLGIAVGHGRVDVATDANNGHHDLSGNIVAPYAAIALLNGDLVLDGSIQFQDLKGSELNTTLATPIQFKGDRRGYRLSGTYYRQQNDSWLTGFTLGGAYLNDDLVGSYLGTSNKYGSRLGELFAGGKAYYSKGSSTFFGSVIYCHDVTAKVDNAAVVFGNDHNGRLDVELGGILAVTDQLKAGLSVRASLLDANTRYSGIYGRLSYDF